MKNLSFSSPGLHKILISKQFTFRLPSLFLIREREHHCRFETCVLENFGSVSLGKWFPLGCGAGRTFPPEAVGTASGGAGVCPCCSVCLLCRSEVPWNFLNHGICLGKDCQPGSSSRVPWPLSLEDKESDLPTWGGTVFTKDAGVCLVQLDRNLILYRLCGGFFFPTWLECFIFFTLVLFCCLRDFQFNLVYLYLPT